MTPSPAPLPTQSGPPSRERIATAADGPDEELFAQVKQRLGVDECRKIYSEMRFRYDTAAKQAWEGQTDGNIIMMRKRALEEEAAADLARKYSVTRRELDALYYHYFKNDGK